jgi:hypothetical protein
MRMIIFRQKNCRFHIACKKRKEFKKMKVNKNARPEEDENSFHFKTLTKKTKKGGLLTRLRRGTKKFLFQNKKEIDLISYV